MDGLSQIVDQTEAERLATGFVFTEGPLWHPDGFYYFVDVRASKFYRIRPGRRGRIAAREHRRGQRHDLRPARPAGDLRGRQPPPDALAGGWQIRLLRGAGRPLRRQAPQPAERCALQVGRQHLFHQPRVSGYRSASASSTLRRSIASSPTARSAMSPISNTRTGSPSRRTSALSMSRIPGRRCTSTRSSSTAPAIWCGGASSPTCPRTRRKACPTA